MNETQKRIKAYQAALPGLRERVFGVALLLVISLMMITSASFAWVTLSRAPEVSSVNTTVAANGNLEIALANPEGTEPEESKVGDSMTAEGQSVVEANQTWGNLVNLSDESYGLENIVLRPALMGNVNRLLDQPLKSVDYGEDGRTQLYYNEDFEFTSWVRPTDGVEGYFAYNETPLYGVRAISTVQYTYKETSYYQFTQLMNKANGLYSLTGSSYDAIIGNDNYINTLAGLIGDYMTDKLNDKNGATEVTGYMANLYNMVVEYEALVEEFGQVLVALANAQIYNYYGPENYLAYIYDTEDTTAFFEAYNNGTLNAAVDLPSLATYKTLRTNVKSVLWGTDDTVNDSIADFYETSKTSAVTFNDVISLINKVVDIGSCRIILPDGTTYTVNGIGMSAATNLLGKTVDAEIAKGILKDFEQLTGYRMCAANVTVKATYIVTVSMTADTITTTAKDPYVYETDKDEVQEYAENNKGEFIAEAQDTYGMALDFWVRTNAADAYLKLEGNVLTKTESVRATGINVDGEEVELYSVTITNELTDEETGETTSVTETVECYYYTSEEYPDGAYRLLSTHSVIDTTAENVTTPKKLYKDVVTVSGYEGVNRVWEKNEFLTSDSTTQGSGSCYVFYAEDPASQENSLRLLSNLRIAFIDATEDSATIGKMVAIARLDTENCYAESGRVTVPIVLMDDGSDYLTKTPEGELAILALEQNKATRLTAIVFLNGTEISNSDVLAANDIQGRMNIQFGSTTPLNTLGDSRLEQETRSVSALAKAWSAASYPIVNSTIEFSYDEATDSNPMTVNVRVTVEGDQPAAMTAFFMRKVNETQGSREESFVLTPSATEEGVWEGSYTFDAPGEYVLRTVQLDGVDYDLPVDTNGDGTADYPTVRITGFELSKLMVSYNNNPIGAGNYTIMTGDKTVPVALSLSLKSDQRLPGSVRLQFMKDDGTQVTANMNYNATTTAWTGTANITSSGVYTLRYVIMDGEYTELDTTMQRALTISMGMTVDVVALSEADFETTYDPANPSIKTGVTVRIYDDTGAMLQYLNNVQLVYSVNGSAINTVTSDMRYDYAENEYACELQLGEPGLYSFLHVKVGDSIITAVNGAAQEYWRISPDPPEFKSVYNLGDVDYALDAAAGGSEYKFGAYIDNIGGAADVKALVRNGDDANAEQLLSGTYDASLGSYVFTLPEDAAGYQHGTWTLVELRLGRVYDADLNYYSPEAPMIVDPHDYGYTDDDLTIQIVSVKISLNGEDQDLDGGQFMGTATAANNITISVTDQKGRPLNSVYVTVESAAIVYEYTSGSSLEYGGYASFKTVNNIELSAQSISGGTITMTKPTLTYAGKYIANSLSVIVKDAQSHTYQYTSEEYDEKASNNTLPTLDIPVYTLTTATPTATISAITPTGSNATKITYTMSSNWRGDTPTFTAGTNLTSSFDAANNTATLYAVPTVDNSTQRHGSFTRPTLTVTVAGVDSGCTVSLALPAGSASAVTFSRTGNGAITKTLGSVSQISSWESWALVTLTHTLDAYYGHGTQTIKTMTVVKDSVTYTVTLEKPIVITNPSSVNQ